MVDVYELTVTVEDVVEKIEVVFVLEDGSRVPGEVKHAIVLYMSVYFLLFQIVLLRYMY